jgi:hypothetical protein
MPLATQTFSDINYVLFKMKLHGNSMVSVYKDIDKSLLPTEYLPDDYKGPSAGSLQTVIGKRRNHTRKYLLIIHEQYVIC